MSQFHSLLGWIPFGVEFTPAGAIQARAALAQNGFPAQNVFEEDAFAEEFLRHGTFDMVASFGLIEHFADVAQVVARHVALLAPGGTLVIRIPRLLGVNYLLARAIDPGCLAVHNLEIMTEKHFASLFDSCGLKTLYCGYQGSVHLTLADEPRGKRIPTLVIQLARKAQVVVNVVLAKLFGQHAPESAALSPFLLYIGRSPLVPVV